MKRGRLNNTIPLVSQKNEQKSFDLSVVIFLTSVLTSIDVQIFLLFDSTPRQHYLFSFVSSGQGKSSSKVEKNGFHPPFGVEKLQVL